MTPLASRSCRPIPQGSPCLQAEETRILLNELSAEWKTLSEPGRLVRTYRFSKYTETMAFANRVAALAEKEDHHPEMTIGYGSCTVAIHTHTVKGLSENDFILAAKIEGLAQT